MRVRYYVILKLLLDILYRYYTMNITYSPNFGIDKVLTKQIKELYLSPNHKSKVHLT